MRMLLRSLCVLPIRLYQRCISPVLPPACRFYPTCSAYAAEAILRHGRAARRAGWRSGVWRAAIHGAGRAMILFHLHGVAATSRLCLRSERPHARR